jgi:DNA-binding response OmpR family regulator
MSILIAEDEKELRDLLQLNLEKEGYRALCAKDGKEALALFFENSVELCIFDIMMPELDGIQLLSRIREKSNVPIIMLTARGEELDKVISFRLGADDYLVKPFSMAELLARIAASLRRSREYSIPKTAPLLQIGELVLDTNSCSVRKTGTTIELNAKEYLLLKFLMENPERVYTKQQLYHAVWQEDYLYDDNTVMVHISRLRNKIETDPSKPEYIITIKGIGYKFCKERKRN